ncbi:MAG: hypothetical protein K2L82_15130 [Lachnospiraceae bacterium]|nr:hypothetical protein [Lachnospiraceae bacterium]
MKKKKIIGMAVIGVVVAIGVLWLCFAEKIKILYTSLNSFKDENLAHTFQHTPDEYSNASEPPFYRLSATSDFNTLEPPQTQDIVMEP